MLVLASFEMYRCGQYLYHSIKTGNYQGYMWLLTGMAAFIFASKTLLRKNLDFMQTMTHEGAHLLIASLLLRRKIAEFNAKSTEHLQAGENLGEVWTEGGSNIILALAPYMLPYITFLFVLIRIMIKNEYLPLFDFIIGFTFMHHVLCWKKDLHMNQSDLHASGIFRSFLYILTFIFFNLAIILYSLGGGTQTPVNIIQANAKWFGTAWADIQYVLSLIL